MSLEGIDGGDPDRRFGRPVAVRQAHGSRGLAVSLARTLEKEEERARHLDEVPVLEPPLLDRQAVQKSPQMAAEVAELEAVPATLDGAVTARDGGLAELQVVRRQAADGKRRLADLDALALQGAGDGDQSRAHGTRV